jgi:DNA polymerase
VIVTVVPDFETASACDLKKAGAWRYAEDPTTEVLCLSWDVDGCEPLVWFPGAPCPPALLERILDPNTVFIAHNAGFEKAIWRLIMVPLFGWPDIPNNRWHDTAARCAQLVIPQELEKVLGTLKLGVEKDMAGNRLTLAQSKVDKKTGMYPARTPEVLARIGEYCKTDVFDQRKLHERIGFLPADERRVYLMDQEINERGIRLDMPLVRAMRSIVDQACPPLAEEFKQLTGGLKMTQIAKVKSWMMDRGVWLPDMTKDTLAAVLGETDEGEEVEADERIKIDLPPEVERALHIRQLIGSASIKKLDAMESCVSQIDGRARGLLRYHRAGPGRWAGTLIQPQNFPRGSVIEEDRQQLVDAIMTRDPGYLECLYGPPVEAVISALRNTLIAADGHTFIAQDYSGVEARIVLALAGQHDKCALMASGVDVYIDMACDIYNQRKVSPNDPEYKAWVKAFKELHLEWRQIGKNTILGCGFQMGVDKFHDRYCPDQPREFAAAVIEAYRKVWAPKVPELWRALEDAAKYAVKDRRATQAFGCTFQLRDEWLTCRLPSGRELHYFEPRSIRKAMPWDEDDVRLAWTYRATKMGSMRTIDAYGGSLTENVVQALARDLLVSAMFGCRRAGLPIVLTVHDEIVTEVPLEQAETANARMEEIMTTLPQWAKDIQVPIQVEGWVSERYKK